MQEKRRISLIIIDDHPLFRQGVEDVLRLEADFEIIGVASTGHEGLDLIKKLRPQVGITDINLPDLNGLMIVKQVTRAHLATRMILLTAYDDLSQMISAFQMGAWGYCTKDIQPVDLVERIKAVARGYYIISDKIFDRNELVEWLAWHTNKHYQINQQDSQEEISPLSPREMEVLVYLSQGQSNKEIAYRMGISHQTVKNHLASLFRKLGVEDRTQAVVLAFQRGWITMNFDVSKE